MDRIEFSQSIDNVTTDDIISRFEEIMALYNIMHTYRIIKISKTQEDIASFSIQFDQDDVSKISTTLNNLSIIIYNTLLKIKCNIINDNLMYISLQRDTGN